MIAQKNNCQQQIVHLFNGANRSIKVAVSWFTDELLIEHLIRMAKKGVKVEVLLSNDNYNLLRHRLFKELINQGGNVRKLGSESALNGGFMHSKQVIIDDRIAFGGSYNFTNNAKSHYEQFHKWDDTEFTGILTDFKNWFSKGDDYFFGVTNPDAILRQLQQQFMDEIDGGFEAIVPGLSDFPEEKYIHRKEIEKEVSGNEAIVTQIRQTVTKVNAKETSINANGKVVNDTSGVVSKPHKFYGGTANLIKTRHATSRTFSVSAFQKHSLEGRYNFLKCRIKHGTLICTGALQPEHCDLYKIRIEFREGHPPMVFITSPYIVPQSAIHIYKEGHLCLYYPGEFKWKDSTKIAEYTIPWIVEWILYYEIWKITGKWEGAEHKH